MKKQANKQPSYTAAVEPQWQEEFVPLTSIIEHGPLQVRLKLDQGAISRYAAMTKAGTVAPLIKLGRVKHPRHGESLYLVDGYHRKAAGAVEIFEDFTKGPMVRALVAPLTEREIRWEAARANLGHGVPLKRSEFRNVFKAFIKACKHHKAKGEFMSYREIATALGVGARHTTLRNWMFKDFPTTARAMGGMEHGNTEGESPKGTILTLEEEHIMEAQWALEALVQHTQALGCPQARWALLQSIEKAASDLKAAGIQKPDPTDF